MQDSSSSQGGGAAGQPQPSQQAQQAPHSHYSQQAQAALQAQEALHRQQNQQGVNQASGKDQAAQEEAARFALLSSDVLQVIETHILGKGNTMITFPTLKRKVAEALPAIKFRSRTELKELDLEPSNNTCSELGNIVYGLISAGKITNTPSKHKTLWQIRLAQSRPTHSTAATAVVSGSTTSEQPNTPSAQPESVPGAKTRNDHHNTTAAVETTTMTAAASRQLNNLNGTAFRSSCQPFQGPSSLQTYSADELTGSVGAYPIVDCSSSADDYF